MMRIPFALCTSFLMFFQIGSTDLQMNLSVVEAEHSISPPLKIFNDEGTSISINGTVLIENGGPFGRTGALCILGSQPGAQVYFTVRSQRARGGYCVLGCFTNPGEFGPIVGVAVYEMNMLYCRAQFDDGLQFVNHGTIVGSEFAAVKCKWNGRMCASDVGMFTTLRFEWSMDVPDTTTAHVRVLGAPSDMPSSIPNARAYASLQSDGDVVAAPGSFIPSDDGQQVIAYNAHLVTFSSGDPEYTTIPFGIWVENYSATDVLWESGRTSRYCLGAITVESILFDDWPTAQSRVNFYEMCNLNCVARRVNASYPVMGLAGGAAFMGIPPSIGWDTNIFNIETSIMDAFSYFEETGVANQSSCPAHSPAPSVTPPGSNLWQLVSAVSLLANVAFIGFAWWLFRKGQRVRAEPSDSQSAVLLAADGCTINLTPLRKVCRPLAVVVSNQNYQFYDTLSHAHSDGAEAASLFERIGYENTIVIQDATLEDFESLPRKIALAISGKDDALVPIFYAGHGVEVSEGQVMFVPVEAKPTEPNMHVSRVRLCSDLQDMNTRRIRQVLGVQQAKRATFVVMADCCREKPSDISPFAEHLAQESLSNAQTLAGGNPSRPRFFFAFACDPGRAARESETSSSGYFTRVLIEEARTPRPLSNLFAAVGAKLERETRGLQRAWTSDSVFLRIDSSLGSEGMCISLAASTGEEQLFTNDVSGSSRGMGSDNDEEHWQVQTWKAHAPDTFQIHGSSHV